jgi:hypothetical protein
VQLCNRRRLRIGSIAGASSPARYAESLNGEAPLRFFEEPLRSRLYDRVQRVGADRDGKFDFDVAGYLVGNWFVDGLPVSDSSNTIGWPKQLAFVYDNYDPSQIRVSIGGTIGMVGAFAVPAGSPDPRTVSPASGRIVYRLLRYGAPGMPAGRAARAVTGRNARDDADQG